MSKEGIEEYNLEIKDLITNSTIIDITGKSRKIKEALNLMKIKFG